MKPDYFGTEQFTDEDRTYTGSRFSEVRDALFANPYQTLWGGDGEPPLPTYAVTQWSVLRGILPFGRPHLFRQATSALSIPKPICAGGRTGRGSAA
jgi:hypothetical protein